MLKHLVSTLYLYFVGVTALTAGLLDPPTFDAPLTDPFDATPPPVVTLVYSNDFFGMRGQDDNRTSEIAAHFTAPLTPVDAVELRADYSTLTSKKSYKRIDELTVLVGYTHTFDGGVWMTSGFGIRWKGQEGGEAIQNYVHRVIGASKETLIYEYGVDRPLVWTAGCYRFAGDWKDSYEVAGNLCVFTKYSQEIDAQVRYVAHRDAYTMWVGPGISFSRCIDSSVTEQAVANAENGLTTEIGIAYENVGFSVTTRWPNGTSVGTFTWRF